MQNLATLSDERNDRAVGARASRAALPAPGDRDFVLSFGRGLVVLNALANRERAQTIAELSHSTQMSRAAVRRLLHTLAELGYCSVEQGRYSAAPRALTLGHAFLSGTPLGRASGAAVNRLADTLQCVAMVMVPDGDAALVIASAGLHGQFPPRTTLPAIGVRVPLHCSASGLLFMSAWPAAQLDGYLAQAPLAAYTHRTPTDPGELRRRLAIARERRYVVCDRTYTPAHRTLAVPVLDRHGAMAAAMVAVIDADRVDPQHLLSDALPHVSEAARALSTQLR